MIKYNNNTIYDWNFDASNVIKVYRNNAIVFYKVSGESPTPEYKVCFAVVDDITQYQETEFEDVFDNATEKWYKLNNLNEYEEYGVYGSGRTSCEGSASRLPQGYTEVEYIENTSTAYIDTGFKPNQDTRITLTAQTVTSQASGKLIGSGGFNKTNAMQFCYEPSSTGSLVVSWGTVAGWTTYSSCIGDYNVHTYDWNKNEFYRDDTLVGSVTYANFQCTDNLGIFRHIQAGDSPSSAAYFKGKIFSFKIFDNGTLVRDFVPCKKDNDEKYGMYDIVNDVFYVSPNNVDFSGGEPVTPTDCVTTYKGKLTIDDGYEYEWNGSSWVNVGEVTGSTATLPDVPFVLNYNAKNYDSSTHTIPYTEGALNAINAVITGTTANIIDHHENGYIQLTGSTSTTIRALVGTTNFSRSNSSPNITIVCKAYTPGSSTEGNILSNRKESYNWMYRHKSSTLRFHGQSEQGSIAVSNTEPNTCSVRIDSSRLLKYNNWTQNTTSTVSNFNYGSNSNGGALFSGYYSSSGEYWKGVFYWIYMTLNTLTDEQVQQVIDYNEGGGQSEYPKYYSEKSDPLNDLTFDTLAEAQTYAYNNCVYDGMKATIDGNRYYFDSSDENGWVEYESRLPQGYTEVEYIENSSYVSNTQSTTRFNVIGDSASGNIYTIIYDMEDDGGSHYMYLFGNDVNVLMQKITQNWANKCIHFKYYGLDAYVESTPLSTKAMIEMDSSSIVITDITASTSTTTTYGGSLSNVNETHYGVFCCYNNNDSGSHSMKGKIYEIKIESSTHVLKNHYIPCYRDSDNKVGLYDIVRDSFYYDQSGQLSLTAGPIV